MAFADDLLATLRGFASGRPHRIPARQTEDPNQSQASAVIANLSVLSYADKRRILKSILDEPDFAHLYFELLDGMSQPQPHDQPILTLTNAQLHWALNPTVKQSLGDVRGGVWQFTAITGEGPLSTDGMTELLSECGSKPGRISPRTEVIVIGRSSWDHDALLQVISDRRGRKLLVYSQELFLLYLLTGRDPFLDEPATLQALADGHPAIAWLSNLQGFDWPSTWIGRPTGQTPKLILDDKKGVLSHFGYEVGQRGLPERRRREILMDVFGKDLLSTLQSNAYIAEWSEPRSARRLEKMAQCLANFSKSAERDIEKRGVKKDLAVMHWESDLQWLYHELYRKYHFSFDWPSGQIR